MTRRLAPPFIERPLTTSAQAIVKAPRASAPPPPPPPLTLFDLPDGIRIEAPKDRRHERRLSIAEAFMEFHRANPWVYDALVELARDLVRRGRRRIGIGMLFEVLRWHYQRATDDPSSDFRLNNNYRSRYARLIMATEPDLSRAFHTRRLRST